MSQGNQPKALTEEETRLELRRDGVGKGQDRAR